MKAISLPDSLCGLVKDENLALNPPVSPQVRVCSRGVSFLCAHTGMCIYLYVFVDIRAGISVKLTSATGLFSPREIATHTSTDISVCVSLITKFALKFGSLTQHIHFSFSLS